MTQFSQLGYLVTRPYEMFRSHLQFCGLVYMFEILPFPLESLEIKEMKEDAPIPPPPHGPWGLLA